MRASSTFLTASRGSALLLCLALSGATPLFADDRAPPSPPPAGAPAAPGADTKGDVELSFDGKGMAVRELLEIASRVSGKMIVWNDYDKALGKQIVGTAARLSAPKERILEQVQALLTATEIVLIPLGPKANEFYVAMDARTLASQFIMRLMAQPIEITDANADEYAARAGLFVSTVISVRNLDDLREARAALQRLVTANNIGSVTEVNGARAFLVSDFAPNVVSIWRQVKMMDVQRAGHRPRAEVIALKHATANRLASELELLFRSGPPNRSQQQPVTAAPEAGPRFVGDDETHQLAVVASEEDLVEIRAIVNRLDVEPVRGSR